MGREAWPDLSVQISRRPWRCLPDPDLCLTPLGATFLRGLAGHAEIWLAPEFLRILDNWPLYEGEPELLCRTAPDPWGDEAPAEDVRHALRIWSRLRDEAGRVGQLLHWVHDAPRESCLSSGLDESFVQRWEIMAEALDGRLSGAGAASGPLIAATRDVTALAGVLQGAAVLCRRDPAEPMRPPWLCRQLAEWRVPCRHVRHDDEVVSRERRMLLDLLVEAGLGGFLWSGVDLAVVHLLVPGEAGLRFGAGFAELDGPSFLKIAAPRPIRGAWDDAQAFWYDLLDDRPHVA